MTKRTPTQATLELIRELHALEQVVTRETLAETMGLKITIVDDHTRTLVETGYIRRVQRGVFVPVPTYAPARPISKTVMPDGTVQLVIGDQALLLTPREDRMLAGLMAGAATQLAAIETGHNVALMASDMNLRLNHLEREQVRAQVREQV